MELDAAATDLLSGYLADFTVLAGDRRTRTLLGATIRGILGSESLVCSRIAAFSPSAGLLPVEREAHPAHARR